MNKILIINDSIVLKTNLIKMLENNHEIHIHECLAGEKECILKANDLVSPQIIIISYEAFEKIYIDIKLYMTKFIVVFDDFESNVEEVSYIQTKQMGIHLPAVYAYITTNIDPEAFNAVIKSVLNDMYTIQKNIIDSFIQHETPLAMSAASDIPRKFQLTEQERIVINHITNGKCNKEIAQNLFLSGGRVKNIVSCVLKKLELNDRTQLAIFAIQNNLYY